MKIDTATYQLLLTNQANQITFYRGKNTIHSIQFASFISFSYRESDGYISVYIERPVVYKTKPKKYPRTIYSQVGLDSFILKNVIETQNLRSGLISRADFRFYKKNENTGIWESTPSQLFYIDGRYIAVRDIADHVEENYYNNSESFRSMNPMYIDKKGEEKSLPIDWNPYINDTLGFMIYNGVVTFEYTTSIEKETRTIALYKSDSLSTILAPHAHLKKSDLQTPNIWGDISARFRGNPFLAEALKDDLAKSAFETLPGIPNDTLKQRVEKMAAEHYPWQKVVFDNARLQAGQGVSQEEVQTTYRTPINTASDNLQSASTQFEGESKKLKRGLSTADLAAGLSDFIVERAQEELNVTFLSRLREGIFRDTAEFSILFPKTQKMLLEFKIVQYRTLLDFAKNAFILDLRNLGLNFPKLFKLTKYREIWNDSRVYNIFLLYDIANKVYDGTAIDAVLLHVHNRLQERRVDLGKSINEQTARFIESDSLKRKALVKYVNDYRDSLKGFEKSRSDLLVASDAWWKKLFPDANAGEQEAANHLRSAWNQDTSLRKYRLASNNLQGDPDYDYLLKELPFTLYQSFFARPPVRHETIGAGIDLSKTLLNPVITDGFRAKIREIEEKVTAMEALRRNLDIEEAKRTLRLRSYIPVFERFREIMTQRACLGLALASEIALAEKFKYMKEHDRQSLIYLKQVLDKPEDYNLFSWNEIDRFNQVLQDNGFDTCTICLDISRPNMQTICGASGAILSEYEERAKLVSVTNVVEKAQKEIENAGIFLEKMAAAIREQFEVIARDTQGIKIKDTTDAPYYDRFLFSKEITDGSLTFDYHKLVHKINGIITKDTLPGREIEQNPDLNKKVGRYEALRKSTITIANPVGNHFFDYYDKTVPFDDVLPFEDHLKRDFTEKVFVALNSVAELERMSEEFYGYLDMLLQQKEAATLLRSLKQTEQFAILTQITLQWLYAFQDASEKTDSVAIRDSTLQRVVQTEPAGKENKPDGVKTAQYDREVSYDVIQVQEKNIGPRRWLTPKKFNDMMEDTLLRRCYMGLLYQRLSAIEGGPRYDARSMALLATKFMNTIYDIDERRELLRYKKDNNQSLRFEDYYPFIRSTVDMLNIVLETPFQTGGETLSERFETLRDVPKISNEVLSLFENVFAENYPNAIRNVVQLLSITWGLDVKTEVQRPRAGAATATEHEKRQYRPKLTREDKKNMKVKSAILTYGSFMANMVGAQTPGQVKAAIRAVAVPAGSSSIKRNSPFNISVNSYLGLGAHREFLTDNAIPDEKRAAFTFGLSVPVGVAFSWANREAEFSRKFWKRWSYSLFFPVIDLGAITAYRIDQKNVNAAMPELNFGNIIAPGAYFMVNFPRSPFTLGAGWQWGPQLRKITVDNNTEITSRAWRIGVTATIDVPIFNIFTSRE